MEEAEDRYKQRDSRPEDIQLITQLQGDIQKQSDTLHQLLVGRASELSLCFVSDTRVYVYYVFIFQDEKRYYQRELVNRETNFNKVFNAAPNVGVMNPFNTKVSTNQY